MPTTLTPLPPAAFSLNRLFASFQTDSLYVTLGVAAVNEFILSGTIFLNREITLRYGSVTVVFRTSALPPAGFNLKNGIGDWAHAIALVPYFQANFYLNRDFTITAPNDAGSPRVVFTAKAIGSGFNFVPLVMTNIIMTNTVAGSGAIKKKNLALSLEVEVKRPTTADYDLVYSERIPFAKTEVSLNISSLLHAELTPDFPAAWDTTTPWRHTHSARPYRLRFAEGYGDVFALQVPTVTDPQVVVWGGTGFQSGLSKLPSQWVQGTTAADDKFLRYGISIRYLQTDEPQWLNFLNTRSTIASLSVQVRVEYADNTITTVTRSIAGGLDANACITIPVWATALTLQTVEPTKAIRSYYVRLKSGSDFVSEEVRFIVDYANREHKQYFVFLNSLGGWDSFLAYGKSTYGFAWTNRQIERPIPADYALHNGDLSDVDGTIRDIFTVATGSYTYEQLRFFRDFFNSPYKYRFINGQCLPISIVAGNIPEGADGQNQYQHEFSYQFAYSNQLFD